MQLEMYKYSWTTNDHSRHTVPLEELDGGGRGEEAERGHSRGMDSRVSLKALVLSTPPEPPTYSLLPFLSLGLAGDHVFHSMLAQPLVTWHLS